MPNTYHSFSRFSRDTSRNSLFSTYDNRSASPSKTKSKPKSPLPSSGYGYGNGNGYGYGYAEPRPSSQPPAGDHHHHHLTTPAFSAYPGSSSSANGSATGSGGFGLGQGQGQGQGHADFRPATPNSRGQYSAAVLDELESQNDEHVGILSGKVKDLKNVRCVRIVPPFFLPLQSHSRAHEQKEGWS